MQLELNEHIIHYERYGQGPELMYCLPGYGETGKEFEALASQMGTRFSVVCADLPLHGQTNWKQPSFDLQDLNQIFDAISHKEGFGKQRIALLGYSMGGRLAMAYAQAFPQRLNKLILLAPDGLHQNFWYWFSTQTVAGRQLFRFCLQNPTVLFSAMKLSGKLGILNPGIAKFSHRYLDDQKQRTLLFERWTMFRNFRPDLAALQVIINTQPLYTLGVFGLYDQISPSAHISTLHRGNNPNLQTLVLEAGHHLLKPQFAPTIAHAIASLKTP